MLYHCFASFKQSQLDFFKLVDSRLILMLLHDSLNLIISVVHQSHLGCWGYRWEKSEVERFGLCCMQDVPVRRLTKR